MNINLSALRDSIVAESVAAYPDFHFTITTNPEGNLTADHRGKWEFQNPHNADTCPFLTIGHDGTCFLVSHYRWNECKKYKTLKGAAKYVNSEIKSSCNRQLARKAKDDAKREFKEKSLRLLRNLHEKLIESGLKSKLCLTTENYTENHISIDAERIKTRIDIMVSHNYHLEMVPSYSRFYATPETAVDILSVLSKKESA